MGIRQAAFKAEKPDSIEYTLNITMTLKDWKQLREQLDEKWPSWELRSKVIDMVSQAERTYYPSSNTEQETP